MASLAHRLCRNLAVSAAALALLAGCATPPPVDDKEGVVEFEQRNDPLEPMNRAVFSFNQGVDQFVLKPAAQGYRFAVPAFGRERVSDFLTNLKSPVYLFNDALQGNGERAGETLARFALNSTFGVLGIMDVAAHAGLPKHEEDFGQTLAVWGVEEGPYLVLPLLGPSNPRDFGGFLVDQAADPVNWYVWNDANREWIGYTRTGLTVVDTREKYLDVLDEVERTSLDYYASIRSLYRQRRAAAISNGEERNIPKAGVGQSLGSSN